MQRIILQKNDFGYYKRSIIFIINLKITIIYNHAIYLGIK